MRRTIQDQIILETTKLETLEKQAHQWTTQELPSINTLDKIFPQMRRLLDTAYENAQSMGPDLENIQIVQFKRRCRLCQASQP